MKVTLRGSNYYIRRRVPQRFAHIEPRTTVWVSLHTDSEILAKTKAAAAWAEMIEAWEAKLAGLSEDAELRFEAAKQLAQTRGFRYLPAARVATLPTEAILERVEAVADAKGQPDRQEAAALLGGVPEGDVPLSVETRLSGAAWFEVMRRPSCVQAGLFDGGQEELA